MQLWRFEIQFLNQTAQKVKNPNQIVTCLNLQFDFAHQRSKVTRISSFTILMSKLVPSFMQYWICYNHTKAPIPQSINTYISQLEVKLTQN